MGAEGSVVLTGGKGCAEVDRASIERASRPEAGGDAGVEGGGDGEEAGALNDGKEIVEGETYEECGLLACSRALAKAKTLAKRC